MRIASGTAFPERSGTVTDRPVMERLKESQAAKRKAATRRPPYRRRKRIRGTFRR
jgi:hypothetical protein